jgi:hypothetical protein
MLTRSDALPYVHTLPFNIPDGTLSVHWPVYIDLPDAGSVADKARHRLSGNLFVTEKEMLSGLGEIEDRQRTSPRREGIYWAEDKGD